MKALILVGGFGTRLRPLTFSKPKPLVEFVNLPMMEYQIAALSKVGVTEIVLAVGYQPDVMLPFADQMKAKYGVTVTMSHEKVPLGTFGAVKMAEEILKKDNEEGKFFLCNADISCDFPFQQMLDTMAGKENCEGVIVLTKVEEPSKYGVVLSNEDGQITSFVEKPQVWVGDCINAGMYLLKTSVLDRLETLRKCSIEREIFPAIVADKQLFQITLQGHWMDVGQPQDYVAGLGLHLGFLKSKNDPSLAPSDGKNIIGNVVIHPSATVSPTAVLGPNVTIGENAVIEDGVRLKDVAVLQNVTVKSNSFISKTIIGWGSTIGSWVRIEGVTVIGEDVQISDEVYINQAKICPHKGVKESLPTKGTIIM